MDTSVITLIITSVAGLFGTTGIVRAIWLSWRNRRDEAIKRGIISEENEALKQLEKEKVVSDLRNELMEEKIKVAELEALVQFMDKQINVMVSQGIAEIENKPEDKMKAWLDGRDR